MANTKGVIIEEKPLIDVMDLNYELSEDRDEQNKVRAYRLKGIFQQADIQNGNGRLYPRSVLEREVQRLQSPIKDKRIIGELDHSADAKIHLDKVSHLITCLEMRTNGEVYGEAMVLETPAGKVLQELLRSGVKLGISSRGFGTVKKHNGIDEVAEDYKMVTFDIVSEPSTPNAFPRAVYEHQENKNDEEPEKIPLALVIEDLLDDMLKDVKIDLSKEYIGVSEGVRFYLAEGAYESYGTLLNHISHYYHLELKDGKEMVKLGLLENRLEKVAEEYGEDIYYKVMNKLGFKGFSPYTLTKSETKFAIDKSRKEV